MSINKIIVFTKFLKSKYNNLFKLIIKLNKIEILLKIKILLLKFNKLMIKHNKF